MNSKLASSVIAVLGSAALSTLAAIPASAAAAGPAIHQVNLHTQMAADLADVRAASRSGIVPVVGVKASPASRATTASCSEPNCDLVYNGGPVQHSPHVYLLLWGPDWTSSSPAYGVLSRLYSGLGTTTDAWSRITSQYGDGSGSPKFTGSVFEGTWQDSSTPPSSVTPGDLAAEAQALADQIGITDTADAQVVVASQTGTCFSDGFGGSCGIEQSSGYCAWHDYVPTTDLSFTNLPYQLDAGFGCGENFVNSGTAGEYDGFSMVAGHEYAESATDPLGPSGWIDTFDTVSGGEIADKCAWGGDAWSPLGSDPFGDVKLSTGTFAMQSLWSNASGRCVMSGDRLTLASVRKQTTRVGRTVSLRMHATTTTGSRITKWSISGQPAGLYITTGGLITGKVKRAGLYRVTVKVQDAAGSTATARFTWVVVKA